MSLSRRARGVALITALLISALAASLAATLAWDNAIDMRRTTVMLFRDEAVQAALGAENWVSKILADDLQDSQTDHLGEIWATEIPVLPLESDSIQGEISGEIIDLQGRFNINNLVDQNGEVDQVALEQFQRLLAALGLDTRYAGIAADWVDSNRDAEFPDGAEDSLYSGFIPPYRAANQLLSTPTELYAIEGMEKAVLDTLLPHIVALPRSSPTPINVNTATAAVLQSLGDNISVADVEGLLAEREGSGFADMQTRFATLIGQQDPQPGQRQPRAQMTMDRLSETSEFFQLKVIVRIDTVRITYFSILYRGNQGVAPILRSLGTQ